MKWVTHQAGALLGAIALQAPLAAVIMVVPGSILPDLADIKMARMGKGRGRKAFNRIHRGASHWFGWWLGLLLLVLGLPLPWLARDALAGLALGAFSHVLLDMLTPKGVPLLPFGQRGGLSTPVCGTGTAGEYIFLACLALGGGLIVLLRLQKTFC